MCPSCKESIIFIDHGQSHSLNAVARHNEDLSWLIEHVETPFFAYQPENVSAPDVLLRTHGNGAYEASAYLQFIAEMYDCLPEVFCTTIAPSPQ